MSDGRSYTGIKQAADAQHKSIWASYLSIGILWNACAYWWRNVPHLSDFMWWGVFIGWGVATVVCIVLSMRVGDRERHARREALADGGSAAEGQGPAQTLSPRERWEAPLPAEVEARIKREATTDDGFYSRVRADGLRDKARRERWEREQGTALD
ncbi:hypothetical protein [Streptomyces smyrnaeus]|uniref:hypothetical protein n=1 Tax=Streptomyces smyrnaeus TaxID=1387713 RepID=UPI0036A42D7C